MQAEDLIGEINRKSGSETRAHIGYGAFAAYFNRGEDLENTVNVERRGTVSIGAQPRPTPTPQARALAHMHMLVHMHTVTRTCSWSHATMHTCSRMLQ